jgi:hypothetical protein
MENYPPDTGEPARYCFRVREQRPGWNILHPVPSRTTVDLAALVCDTPEFLGMDGGETPGRAAVVLSERGDARVLAAVDETGRITLIGCPARLTRDALTTVTQDLLGFTGRLWRMPVEEFIATFEQKLGRSLGDCVAGRGVPERPGEDLRSGLSRSLAQGRFPVVLLVMETNGEVADAAAHLQWFNVGVRQLGVEIYESSGVEIVVPRTMASAEPRPHEEHESVGLVASPPAGRPIPRFSAGSPKPAARPTPSPPAPTPPAGARPSPLRSLLDGTMPGVFAGKRPVRRQP